MIDERQALRRQLRERRAAIAVPERVAAAAAVAEHLLKLPAVRDARHVAGYWAIGGELPLHAVVGRLPATSRYCLPVLQDDGKLAFAPWRTGEAIVANRFGIPEPTGAVVAIEPAEVDIVLLPLLGFTRDGHRLGTGGGWYDRSFAFRHQSPAPPLLVGVGFACQQVDACEVQAWDVPLDMIVTERELIACTR
jgi:5-formyltetrahydrofolate cyclo-ligase